MAAIAITDVTDGTITGNGAFDKLMAAGLVHITNEYDNNRITGADYSTVYLGMLQASMAQAVQFVLGKQTADKQADLIAEKITTEKAQTVDSTAGTTYKQQLLLQAQTDGFARDAEQKVGKMFADIHAINVSALGSGATLPAGLDDPNITLVMNKVAAGISVSLT